MERFLDRDQLLYISPRYSQRVVNNGIIYYNPVIRNALLESIDSKHPSI